MNTSTIKSHFLTHPEDLGIVTVGFSGGQVRFYTTSLPTTSSLNADLLCNSKKLASMQALPPSSSPAS